MIHIRNNTLRVLFRIFELRFRERCRWDWLGSGGYGDRISGPGPIRRIHAGRPVQLTTSSY